MKNPVINSVYGHHLDLHGFQKMVWKFKKKSCMHCALIRGEVIKLFSCSTQPSTKFFMLINVKMPTIVGILTFMSRIDTTSEILKARNFFICRYFSFYEQLIFCAQLS